MTTRSGRMQTTPERLDRESARSVLRDLLLNDGQQTGDRAGYQWAINIIDAGWCSVKVFGIQYVAFACACPQLPREKVNDGNSEISQVLTM
ncbi:hypothetical protein SMC26_19600 [Actinomadura fulvescens]